MRPRISKHQMRAIIRRLGLVRCEWCGRFREAVPGMKWREVAIEEWIGYLEDHQVFVCERPVCRQRHEESGGTHPRRSKGAAFSTPTPAEPHPASSLRRTQAHKPRTRAAQGTKAALKG